MSQACTGLENRRPLVLSPAQLIFLPKIDDSHCDGIHSSLTATPCFKNGYVVKQPVTWKKYSAEYCRNAWLVALASAI